MNTDLFIYIFIRTDEKDIYNLRLTCKYFLKIIDHDYFWINKILYKFPALKYNIKNKNYKKYYYELCEIFKEKNLHYISAIAQDYEEEDILKILSSYPNFQHSKLIVNMYDQKNIKEIYYTNPINDFKEGKFISYYNNRKVKEISMYKNNKRNGFCLLKDVEGNSTEYSNYKDGEKHGKCKYFNDNVEIACNYYIGVLNGKLESFIDKNIFEEIYYIDSFRTGYYKRYYYNGILKEKGNYKNDMKHGKWIYYDLDGKIISEANYENDIFDFL